MMINLYHDFEMNLGRNLFQHKILDDAQNFLSRDDTVKFRHHMISQYDDYHSQTQTDVELHKYNFFDKQNDFTTANLNVSL